MNTILNLKIFTYSWKQYLFLQIWLVLSPVQYFLVSYQHYNVTLVIVFFHYGFKIIFFNLYNLFHVGVFLWHYFTKTKLQVTDVS